MATFDSVTGSQNYQVLVTNQFTINSYRFFDPDYVAPGAAWLSSSTEQYAKFSSNFTINKYLNLSVTYSLRSGLNSGNGTTVVQQVPISLNTPGPISLRGRSKAYILVPEGHNPSTQAGIPTTLSV